MLFASPQRAEILQNAPARPDRPMLEASVPLVSGQVPSPDPQVLDALVRQYTPGIYRFARRMTRSEEEAWDITQETFLRMVAHLDSYDPAFPFQTWLFRIARNLCVDRARRHTRWKFSFFRRTQEDDDSQEDSMAQLPATQDSALEDLLKSERSRVLDEALQKLKGPYKEVLVLYHFEELSYQDIATVLSIPIGTVMNRIFRARQQLKELLGDALVAA